MSSSAASGRTSNTKASLLSDRAVIAVSGDDAREFLQGLITNDIHKVVGNKAVFSALLSPQGKFLYDFFIIEHNHKLFLDVNKAFVADLIKRLTMYKLRSKVEIAEVPNMKIGVDWGSGVHIAATMFHGAVIYDDPRLRGLGVRAMGEHLMLKDNGEYEKHRLSLGVPEGGKDLVRDRSFPMQWGYDKLNAIDFNKGCYVGQEVTARTKHIGSVRKMVYKIQAASTLPDAGTPVMADEKEIGHMASSIGNIGLALLNIEVVESSVPLYSGEVTIRANMSEWVLR